MPSPIWLRPSISNVISCGALLQTLRAYNSDLHMIHIPTRATLHTRRVRARFSPDQYTDLSFIPLAYTPQGAGEAAVAEKVKYAIASFKFRTTYLHMNGLQLFVDKVVRPRSGGHVNCQYSVGPMEMFCVSPISGVADTITIQSAKYPNVFLRLPRGLTATKHRRPPRLSQCPVVYRHHRVLQRLPH
jgi:hypothetical protein